MEKYLSAAARHWDSSERLKNDGCFEEAAYLSGYIAECAVKGLLVISAPRSAPSAFSHEIGRLASDGLLLAMLLSPAVRRAADLVNAEGLTGLIDWKPEMRYWATGSIRDGNARSMVAEGEKAARRILIGLALDGLIDEVPL